MNAQQNHELNSKEKDIILIATFTATGNLPQLKNALNAGLDAVLTYYAVADKKDPLRITILEIYADSAAYLKHIATPHFEQQINQKR